MKSLRLGLILGVGVAALVAIGLGVRKTWRLTHTPSVLALIQPPAAELAARPEAFRTRCTTLAARLAAAPADAIALGELVQLCDANGFSREAEAGYRELLALDAANPRWPHLLAALVAGYGRLDEAIPLWQRTVALAPDYVPARLSLADACLKANRIDEADAGYRAVLARAPNHPYALLGLARVELATGRLTAARETLTRAVTAEPAFFGAQSLLASVFERLGDDEAAATARTRANAAGRFRDAPDPWVEGLTDFCYDVYRLQVAAATARTTGTPREAKRLLERALALAPDDAHTERQLGNCQLALRELDEARVHLEKAVALAPTEVAGYRDLAAAFLALRDEPAAIRTIESGFARAGDQAALHFQLAMILAGQRRWEEAVPHLQSADRLAPEKPEAACELVTVLFRLKREAEAAATLTGALARHPEDPPLLLLAARQAISQRDAAAAGAYIAHARRNGAPDEELRAMAAEYRRVFGAAP